MHQHNLSERAKGLVNAIHMGQQLLAEGQMEDVQHNLSPNIIQTELLHCTKLTCMLRQKYFLSRILFFFFFRGERKERGKKEKGERVGREGGGEERLSRISDVKLSYFIKEEFSVFCEPVLQLP